MPYLSRLRHAIVVLFTGATLVQPAALAAPADPLGGRANDLGHLFTEPPVHYPAYFAPEFLAALPPDRLNTLLTGLGTVLGKTTRVRRVGNTGGRFSGVFNYDGAKGMRVKAELAIAPQAPHLITGLLFRSNPMPLVTSFSALQKSFKELPGKSGFLAARLTDDHIERIASQNPDAVFNIDSAFKLWVLGRLIEDVAAGRHQWEEVTTLGRLHRAFPSGRMMDWPPGAPITLHSLATAMISESDNTATDHLIDLLGREQIEATMARMGMHNPALNRPLLATNEHARLKGGPNPALLKRWGSLGVTPRRAFLANEVAAIPRDDVRAWTKPTALDSVRWAGTPTDLVQALAWLNRQTTMGRAALGRGVLAVNPGLPGDRRIWPYQGFKGGSEPGAVTMTFLRERADGSQFAFAASWNDPAKEVDQARFFALCDQALDLLEQQPATRN